MLILDSSDITEQNKINLSDLGMAYYNLFALAVNSILQLTCFKSRISQLDVETAIPVSWAR